MASTQKNVSPGTSSSQEGASATEGHRKAGEPRSDPSSSGSIVQALKDQPSTSGSRDQAEVRPKRDSRSRSQLAPADVVIPPSKERIKRMSAKVFNTSRDDGEVRVLKGTYTVERILDKKYEDGAAFYLVKWKRYKASRNTWEPYYHFSPRLLRQWEDRQIQKHPNSRPGMPSNLRVTTECEYQ